MLPANTPVASLGLTTLTKSTTALAGDGATYSRIEGEISALTSQRDALAAKMIQKLEGAESQASLTASETERGLAE
jgi:hypothetical protein